MLQINRVDIIEDPARLPDELPFALVIDGTTLLRFKTRREAEDKVADTGREFRKRLSTAKHEAERATRIADDAEAQFRAWNAALTRGTFKVKGTDHA